MLPDWIFIVYGIVSLTTSGVIAILTPFAVGRVITREVDGWRCLGELSGFAFSVLISGRLFGWW